MSYTQSADRTQSRRKRAGSRRNKKFKNVGVQYTDWWGRFRRIGEGMPANHKARAVDIDRYFPSLSALVGHHH